MRLRDLQTDSEAFRGTSEFDVKLKHLEQSSEERLRSLSTQVQQFFESIRTDPVYNTMRQSSVSQGFAYDHARELFFESM